jgi:hypothetical protein
VVRSGCVSAVDSEGRTVWIADAHRGEGKRFVVRADEILTAFLELEAGIRARDDRAGRTGEIFLKIDRVGGFYGGER